MRLTNLDFVFWFVSFLEHLALLYISLRVHRFPILTCLIGFNVLRTVLLFFLRSYGPAGSYYYAYWSMAVVDVTLQLGIVYELTLNVFRPSGRWSPKIKGQVMIWAGLSVVVAAMLTRIPTPDSEFWLQVVVLKGGFFSAALMSELFVGMLVLSARSRLNWSDEAAKIALGFMVFSLATLLLETANTYFGLRNQDALYNALSRIRIGVYICCAAYWIASLLPSMRRDRPIPDHIERQASAISGATASGLETLRSEAAP